MEHTILLLEDDADLIDGLMYSLNREGYIVDVVQTVKTAYVRLETRSYSLLLLDVTLPDGNGVDVCRRVREQGSRTPIIFLTAMDDEVNVIRGLDSGADDYITKPFKLGELCSRIFNCARSCHCWSRRSVLLSSMWRKRGRVMKRQNRFATT